MDIIRKTSTMNTTAASGRAITYLVIHYTAGTSSKAGSAVSTAAWFSQAEAKASADFIVDDRDAVQYNPDPKNRYCWAVGGSHFGTNGGSLYGKAKNANCISIEVCSTNSKGKITYPNDPAYSFTDAVIRNAAELARQLMAQYSIPVQNVIRHYDVNGKCCPGIIGWNADSGDESRWEAFKAMLSAEAISTPDIGLQASSLISLSEAEVVSIIGPLCTQDMEKSGVLASVSAAQFILESGYGKTELAQKANNCFGMKCTLSANTWNGSTWDGKSIYTKQTLEDDGKGRLYTITADFRKYPYVEDSIADHSAYLLGAKNGGRKRYAGLKDCTDYREAIQLIKDGGYATDTKYVSKICSIIERWDLTQYDTGEKPKWYRVRRTWEDSSSQKGAFRILENAKKRADENPGYSVYDPDGKALYTSAGEAEMEADAVPYLVRVGIPNLNIRTGPGMGYPRTGAYTGIGVFIIVAESGGWGKLKSGAGWICLEYTERV